MSIDIREKNAVDDLLYCLSESPVIFDIGSNKGEWSDLIMSKNKEATFHFFEPNKIMLDFTKIKYDYNTNIVFNKFAMWSKPFIKLDFFYFENFNNGLSSLKRNERWVEEGLPMRETQVNSMTIDEYCRASEIESVDFIKIDVEGAEYQVLLGAESMLKSGAIKFIQLEYSEHYKLFETKFADIITFVNQFGYNVYSYSDNGFELELPSSFNEIFDLSNFIITKEQISNTQNWNSPFVQNTKHLGKLNFILEIGCFEGLTSKHICNYLLKKEGRMIAVDPLSETYLVESIDSRAEQINKELDYFKGQYNRFLINTGGLPITLYRKTFAEAIPELKDFRFDLIYVDGDHRENAVYFDAVNSFELLQPNGHILFDDYEWGNGETKRGIDRFIDEYAEFIEVVNKNEQVLVKRLKRKR